MEAIAWLEQSAASVFMREDAYAYFLALIGHALGMAFFVGTVLAVALRHLGFASGVPLDRLVVLRPAMMAGAVLAIISGLCLLAGYPAKALTNWLFPAKLIGLLIASVLAWRLTRCSEASKGQASWAGALALFGVAGGKLLLYTNTMLLTTD